MSKKGLGEKGDSDPSTGKDGIGTSSSGDKGNDNKGGQEGRGGGSGGGGERKVPGGPEMVRLCSDTVKGVRHRLCCCVLRLLTA